MERLQVDVPNGTRARLKAEAKARGMYLSSLVTEKLLVEKKKAASRDVVIIDPQVQQILDHFSKTVAPIRGQRTAIIASKQMISDYGFERVIGAINAVKDSKGKRFAPVIASLPTLQEKWTNLEHFYLSQRDTKKVFSA